MSRNGRSYEVETGPAKHEKLRRLSYKQPVDEFDGLYFVCAVFIPEGCCSSEVRCTMVLTSATNCVSWSNQ